MKEKIIELRKQGYTVKQIAKELNCVKGTVSYHINKYKLGGNINHLHLDVDKSIIDNIVTLKKNNISFDEICQSIPLSIEKIKIISRNLDMHNLYNNQDLIKEINEYYNEVKSLKKCGEHFNLSRHVVRKIVVVNQNPKKIINKTNYVISWRKRLKVKLVEYKGGKCEICGYNKSIRALQFHHILPNEKDFTISNKNYSFDKMMKEIDKCILVCANCHQEIHEKIDNDNAGNA